MAEVIERVVGGRIDIIIIDDTSLIKALHPKHCNRVLLDGEDATCLVHPDKNWEGMPSLEFIKRWLDLVFRGINGLIFPMKDIGYDITRFLGGNILGNGLALKEYYRGQDNLTNNWVTRAVTPQSFEGWLVVSAEQKSPKPNVAFEKQSVAQKIIILTGMKDEAIKLVNKYKNSNANIRKIEDIFNRMLRELTYARDTADYDAIIKRDEDLIKQLKEELALIIKNEKIVKAKIEEYHRFIKEGRKSGITKKFDDIIKLGKKELKLPLSENFVDLSVIRQYGNILKIYNDKIKKAEEEIMEANELKDGFGKPLINNVFLFLVAHMHPSLNRPPNVNTKLVI